MPGPSQSLIERAASVVGSRGLHDALTPAEREALRYCWPAWARPTAPRGDGTWTGQLPPPGDWSFWLVLAGRSFGKTRLAAEWVRSIAESQPGSRIALVGRTSGDTRKVMVFGESGLLSICPPWNRPEFIVTDQCLVWRNGSTAWLYSADKPDQLRGPQHTAAWCDEIAAWRRMGETWDNITMGLRLGRQPRAIVTTTPRPLRILKELRDGPATVVTVGKTTDNRANLPGSFYSQILARYEGTTLGRQELEGELFDEMPGALWQRAWIDRARVRELPPMRRVVVGVDPALSSSSEADEAGVVVCGLGEDGHGYVLEDGSIKASPDGWARKAVALWHKWRADALVEETIRGGELVSSVIKLVDPNVLVLSKGGNRGKHVRAEPVAALYEQGRVHHVGLFPALEDQMCTYTLDSKESPNNMDAMVYALTELMLAEPEGALLL